MEVFVHQLVCSPGNGPQGFENTKLVLCLRLCLSTEEHTELIPK